jgi:hypothetical protein
MCFVCQKPDRKIIQHCEPIFGVLAKEEGDKYVSRGGKKAAHGIAALVSLNHSAEIY